MAISPLRELVAEDFKAVDSLILQKIQEPQVSLLSDLGSHILRSGGKRLRPLLVLLASKACGYTGKKHIALAAMMEFLHTATLLHDDVVDESTLRRGQETANQIWGNKASILVGDFLFSQYMQLLIEVGNGEIMQVLSSITYQVSCGEIKQHQNRHKPTLTTEEYYEVISLKTSLMFAACAKIAGIISEASPVISTHLFNFGLHLGNAFQLIDDALDYCSDAKTIGKNIGDDLAEGKATLPLLYVLETGTAEQQKMVKASLQDGSLEALPQIIQAMKETKAIEYTQAMAKLEIDKALAAIQHLEDSIYKEALINLANYTVARNH